jgi:Flp pilus assembly secretin CpaC
MALAHEPARSGFSQCLSGGAVVAVSVGTRTLVPGAQARRSDCAVTLADGSAVAERHGALSHGGLANPQHHQGGSHRSRWALRPRVCTPGVAHH